MENNFKKIKYKTMATTLIIFAASLITLLFICNTHFMRNLGDKFSEFLGKIIDKINRY